MKYLQKVPIHKDDLFFIPAGTIHAIGAGALVAEIQESSNLTYRPVSYTHLCLQVQSNTVPIQNLPPHYSYIVSLF